MYILLARNYNPCVINSAIARVRKIPRKTALRKRNKINGNQPSKRPVFAITYDPRLPSIPSINVKHWRSMIHQDPYLAEVFPQPPLTAFKRQNNIKDYIIRAKVPKPLKNRSERNIKGMFRCGKDCPACPYILQGKT